VVRGKERLFHRWIVIAISCFLAKSRIAHQGSSGLWIAQCGANGGDIDMAEVAGQARINV